MKTLDVINQILSHELNLSDDRIWAYNNNIELPKDSGLFIVLFLTSQKPYSNNVKYKYINNEYKEIQSTNIAQNILISAISKNTSARDRAWEIPLAFNSNYSIDLQTKNQIHISPIGDIYDASFLEETARLNRFDFKIRVFTAHDKINNIDYYDKFGFSIWTNSQNEQVIKTPITIQGE